MVRCGSQCDSAHLHTEGEASGSAAVEHGLICAMRSLPPRAGEAKGVRPASLVFAHVRWACVSLACGKWHAWCDGRIFGTFFTGDNCLKRRSILYDWPAWDDRTSARRHDTYIGDRARVLEWCAKNSRALANRSRVTSKQLCSSLVVRGKSFIRKKPSAVRRYPRRRRENDVSQHACENRTFSLDRIEMLIQLYRCVWSTAVCPPHGGSRPRAVRPLQHTTHTDTIHPTTR